MKKNSHSKPRRSKWWLPALVLIPVLLCSILLAYIDLAPAAAIIYVPTYLWISVKYPDLALFVMFGSAIFPYDLSAGGPVKLALGEINLIIAAPVIIHRASAGGWFRFPPLVGPVTIYFAVCAASSLLNGITASAIVSMTQMAVYLLLAVTALANYSKDTQVLKSGFYGIIFAGAILASASVITRSSYVLGMHKNAVGSSLSFAAVAAFGLWLAQPDRSHTRWLRVAMSLIMLGLVFSLSRGAWMGTVVGMAIMLLLARQFRLLRRAIILAIPVVALGWFMLPPESREYALDVSPSANNVKTRLASVEHARELFNEDPLLGKGVGLRKTYDATNVIWSTLAETGVIGLIAFAFIHYRFVHYTWREAKSYPRPSPEFPIIAISAGLIFAKLTHGMVDHYWARTLLTVWGSAGMSQGLFLRRPSRRTIRDGVPSMGAPVSKAYLVGRTLS